MSTTNLDEEIILIKADLIKALNSLAFYQTHDLDTAGKLRLINLECEVANTQKYIAKLERSQ